METFVALAPLLTESARARATRALICGAAALLSLHCGGALKTYDDGQPVHGITGAPSGAPAATPSSSGSSSSSDTFDEDVARIKSIVPKWDNGTGIAIRYLKESTGKRTSLIYVDPTPPEWKEKADGWLVISKAKVDGKIFSTVSMILPKMAPGSYRGSPNDIDLMMGAAVGTDRWEPKAGDVSWSSNDGGWCELTLTAINDKDFEGSFRGKLVDNSGGGFVHIETGYIYINR